MVAYNDSNFVYVVISMNKTPDNKIRTSWMVEEIFAYVNLCPTETLLKIYNDLFGHEITVDQVEAEEK